MRADEREGGCSQSGDQQAEPEVLDSGREAEGQEGCTEGRAGVGIGGDTHASSSVAPPKRPSLVLTCRQRQFVVTWP